MNINKLVQIKPKVFIKKLFIVGKVFGIFYINKKINIYSIYM